MLFSWLNLGILKQESMGTDSPRVASRETTIFPAVFFFFNPKTALSEAPEASMIFSQ